MTFQISNLFIALYFRIYVRMRILKMDQNINTLDECHSIFLRRTNQLLRASMIT